MYDVFIGKMQGLPCALLVGTMPDLLPIALIIFFANLTQSLSGFGMGLVAMSLLAAISIPLRLASPLVALIGLASQPVMIIRHRRALRICQMWRLSLASVIGIPIGVLLLSHVDGQIIRKVLGLVVSLYALFSLLRLGVPRLENRGWAFGLGFAAGVLGGAYNIAGPPAVIYATGQGWPPAAFKANLQTFALVNSVIISLAHRGAANFTPEVLELFVMLLPVMIAGLGIGFLLDRLVDPARFGRLVLILLLLTGLRLLL